MCGVKCVWNEGEIYLSVSVLDISTAQMRLQYETFTMSNQVKESQFLQNLSNPGPVTNRTE